MRGPAAALVAALALPLLAGCTVPDSGLREVPPPPVAPSETDAPGGSTPAPTARGPVTTAARVRTPAPPPTFCAAGLARTWHEEFQDAHLTAGTMAFSGTDAGEPLDLHMAFDEALDYLLLRDQAADAQLYARGDRVIVTEAGASTEFRDVGSPSYAVRFLEDLGEEEPEDPSSDWFTTPTSAFAPTCTSHGGSAAYKLSYSGGGVQEEWVWDTAGNLHYASFKRSATSTDVRATMRATATPIAPPAASERAASITYSILSEAVQDGFFVQVIQVEPGTFRNAYSDVTIDLFRGDTMVAELAPGNDWSGDHGAVSIEDRGQAGILDEGDIIGIAMDPALDGWLLYDSWSDRYAGEEVVDSDGEPLELVPEPGGEVLERHYEWTFDGASYTYDLGIPLSLLDYYEGQDFTYHGGGHNYVAYVASQYDDPFIQAVADELLRVSAEEGHSEDEALSLALAFVQSLEYTSDNVTTGYDDFPRYPVETLAESGGDCEDTAILYAAIAQAMGYGAVLLNPPGHMATGVLVEAGFQGVTYTFEGRRWAYAETTGDGWRIGQIPDNYRTANARILSLEPQGVPVIDSATAGTPSGGYHPIQVTFSNDGLAATSAGRVTVYGMNGDRTLYYDSDHCTFAALAPGNSYTCDLDIRADRRITAFQAVLQTDGGQTTRKDF